MRNLSITERVFGYIKDSGNYGATHFDIGVSVWDAADPTIRRATQKLRKAGRIRAEAITDYASVDRVRFFVVN